MRPRHLLLVALLAGCARAPGSAPAPREVPLPDAASVAARELTADQQVAQALSRLTFGARPGDAERVRAMGVDRWIARQLDAAAIPDTAVDRFVAGLPTQQLPLAALVDDYPPPGLRRAMQRRASDGPPTRDDSAAYREAQRRAALVGQQLQTARLARALTSERQLQEVMTDFWENHFNVFAGKGPLMRHYLVAYDRDVIRPRALGRFRDLLGAVAKSPAMLVYLDNAQSAADSTRPTLAAGARREARLGRRGGRRRALPASPPPRAPNPPGRQRRGLNENYARELLELHTLGVDGGYTQQDVIQVARAFTGWTVLPPRAGAAMGGAGRRARDAELVRPLAEGSLFVAPLHDAGAKTVLGHALAAGRGVEDGEEVLDIVARHPATARRIARKLAQRLVSDTPPAALVERAAATFTRTDGDIREVVRTIVTSPEFFARAAWRAKVKSPFEVVASALRATNAVPDPTPRAAALVGRLGQPLFGHQAPDGWPETGEAWVNTGAILQRINFGMAVAAGRVPGARRERWPFARTLDAAPRERQVDAVVGALLGGSVSPDTRAVLVSGTNPLAARAVADTMPDESRAGADAPPTMLPPGADGRPRRRPGRDPFAPVELTGLAQIVGLALGAPEFQRR